MPKHETQEKEEQSTPEGPAARSREEISFEEYDLDAMDLSDQAVELIQRIERERDEAIDARKRALADFKNFQRRSAENELRALDTGAARIVRSLIPVLDQFDLALQQDMDAVTVDQLRAGVELVQSELVKALQSFNVEIIDPETGEEFDPNRHEAMVRQPTMDLPPNSVASVYQPGYAIGNQILRPAKVVVTSEPDE